MFVLTGIPPPKKPQSITQKKRTQASKQKTLRNVIKSNS